MKTRAAVLRRIGELSPYVGSQPLQIEELELGLLGFGQVLVEVAAAGLCHSDLSVIDGSRPRPLPMVLGHEASGIVRETGPGVRDVAAGDHVVFSFVPMCGRCVFCAAGRPALCEKGARSNLAGTLLDGSCRFHAGGGEPVHHHLGVSAFSQYTIAMEESLVRIEPGFPLDKAALFGCAVMTGVGAVLNTAGVQAGASIAIFGLGGVGLSALLGAKIAGAYPVIAVDRQPAKLDHALALGATAVVRAGEDDVVAAVRELSGGGVHYAVECVGSERALGEAYAATRRGGTTVTVGLPGPDQMLSISALSLTAEEKTIKGSFMGSCLPRRDLPRFMALYQAGKLPVESLVSRTIALEEINGGFDLLQRGEVARQLVRFG